jgi:hypothetical protein
VNGVALMPYGHYHASLYPAVDAAAGVRF